MYLILLLGFIIFIICCYYCYQLNTPSLPSNSIEMKPVESNQVDSYDPPQESSTPTSFITPPSIINKLDLSPEEYTEFLKDYEKLKEGNLPRGDSSDLIQSVVVQIPDNIDKEAVYIVMMKYIGNRKINKDMLPSLMHIASYIVMNRKVISDPNKKTILDKRLDINKMIKSEFRNVRLSSKYAHRIRKFALDFINKTQCVLTKYNYNDVILFLVRGYGVITRLYTMDDAINDAIVKLNTDCSAKPDDELIQYGLIALDGENWVPTLKAKLYSYKHCDNPFIESNDRITNALKELCGCKEPKHHQDLFDNGYIEYTNQGWKITDKVDDIENDLIHFEDLNINDNDLYNDILSCIKSNNFSNCDDELYAQNVFMDLKSFLCGLTGKLSKDDYNTMIVNISRAFSIL